MAQRFTMSFLHCIWLSFRYFWSTRWPSFPGGSADKEWGDPGSTPGWERYPGEGNGKPLQDSCLEKSHGQRSLAVWAVDSPKGSDMTE